MLNPNKEIEDYRQHYASYSRADLIKETLKWVPHAPQHIAAKQLIDEMDKADSDQKHRESLQQSHRANKLSIWAIIIALLSLLLFTIDFVYRDIFSPKHENRKTEEIKSRQEQQQSARKTVPKTMGFGQKETDQK